MAYFADLTPYSYSHSRFTEQPDALNVGWLEDREAFLSGNVPEGFPERLRKLTRTPVNLYRGWHTCWCGVGGGRDDYANGEIRVTGADGTVYAAPVLIAHYVDAHRYLPPQAFIDAVLATA